MINKISLFVKNGFLCSFYSGFMFGCFPNKIQIKFKKKYYYPPIPLLTGFVSSMSFIFSPLLLINYFSNSCYFDKLIDKYDIEFERYHQYNNVNNKYAYPSVLHIKIKHIEKQIE